MQEVQTTRRGRRRDRLRVAGAAAALFLAGALPFSLSAQVQVRPAAGSAPAALAGKSAPQRRQAATAPVAGPVLGYSFNRRAARIEAMHGIPGAASVARSVPLDFHPAAAAVSSQKGYALAAGRDGGLHLVDLSSSAPAVRPLTEARSALDRIALSPNGSAAALYDRGRRLVEVLTGLPAEPETAGRYDAAELTGALTALAVSDSGETLLAATAGLQGGGLYALREGGPPRLITPGGHITSLRFLHGVEDAVAADFSRNEVSLVRGVQGGFEAIVVAASREGVRHPRAAATDEDNRRLFVASTAGTVLEIDLETRAAKTLQCRCNPTMLRPLRDASVFQLTDSPSGPVWALDARGAEARFVFIPRRETEETPPDSPGKKVRILRGRGRR